jgi:D-amino peptidase
MVIFISADIEGVALVVRPEQANAIEGGSSSSHYARARTLMTDEIRAAMEGAAEVGDHRFLINDSHSIMINYFPEDLPEMGEFIQGSPKPFGMMEGIDRQVDCAFFIGYHAAAGTLHAVLDHTSNDRVFSVALNGKKVGEFGMNLALAGHFHVPVVLVTGDEALKQEVLALHQDLEFVVTKRGITRTSASCMHPTTIFRIIKESAAHAISRAMAQTVRIHEVHAPITLDITFVKTIHADMAELIPGSLRMDGRTVRWIGSDMPTVYRTYRGMLALSGTV